MKLRQETNKLLTRFVTDRELISVKLLASKSGVSANWIYRYLAGDIIDPGVNRMQKIYDYLTKYDRAVKARAGRARKRNLGGK